MNNKKYKIEIKDFGKQGDLKNGWGYSVYLNEKENHSFENKIHIYGFNNHAIIRHQNKTGNKVKKFKSGKFVDEVQRSFPIGIVCLNDPDYINKAEEKAHKYTIDFMAERFAVCLGLPKEDTEIIDKTRFGKSLEKNLKR